MPQNNSLSFDHQYSFIVDTENLLLLIKSCCFVKKLLDTSWIWYLDKHSYLSSKRRGFYLLFITWLIIWSHLRLFLSYRNQISNLKCKSIDWFLYDRNMKHWAWLFKGSPINDVRKNGRFSDFPNPQVHNNLNWGYPLLIVDSGHPNFILVTPTFPTHF